MTTSLAYRSKISVLSLLALPLAAFVFVACTGDDTSDDLDAGGRGGGGGSAGSGTSHAGTSHGGAPRGGASNAGAAGTPEGGSSGGEAGNGGASGNGAEAGSSGEAGNGGAGGNGGEPGYEGPIVGRARTFAALAYSAITTANISVIGGELGVSASAVSSITGFDGAYTKYGNDSLAPNSQRTILAQADVTALVADIDPRPCDVDLTNVVGGLTGDITLHPGVTCMNSFSAAVLVNGHVYLDAGGDPNAFFVIKGNLTLDVADGAEVVLQNGAQACAVFWRIAKEVTIGKTVKFFGSVVSGTAITMKTGSTLNGRALAQTAGVQLDANSVIVPAACTHVQ